MRNRNQVEAIDRLWAVQRALFGSMLEAERAYLEGSGEAHERERKGAELRSARDLCRRFERALAPLLLREPVNQDGTVTVA